MKEFTLFIGHGSRDPEGNLEFFEFVNLVRNTTENRQIEACFLELTTPTISDGIETCIAQGATRIVVVPVILLAASHVKLEIPVFLDEARKRHPNVQIVYGRNIGLHERMIDMLTSRFHERISSQDKEELADTAIVLMGRGSSDPDANGDLYKIARQVWERTGVSTVEVCFTGITFPRLPDGVNRAIALGAKRIVVVPYFLFTGVLIKRMTDVLEKLQLDYPTVPMSMAEYFGMHPNLIEIVFDRRDEAAAGRAFMNCDLCKYRKLVTETHEHHHDHSHDHHYHDGHETRKDQSVRNGGKITMVGQVFLIGAGPGDPGLLTLKAKACLEQADVVMFDHLVSKEILAFASEHAEQIYVGKEARNHTMPQIEIELMMIKKAFEGYTVARLKGGDPFIYGRGAEEAESLRNNGIPFEIIPGISSAIAVPAYAGIPLTHRRLASGFHVVTGHECLQSTGTPWQLLALSSQTLVILMGIGHLREIVVKLVGFGRRPETPVAVIRWGTTINQKVVIGTLDTIADIVEAEHLEPPAIIVIGDVVQLHEKLDWFQSSTSERSAQGKDVSTA